MAGYINLPSFDKSELKSSRLSTIVENDELKMILKASSETHSREIEIVYSDDKAFESLTNTEYAEGMNKPDIEDLLGSVFKDESINLWKPKFPTELGEIFHYAYSGTFINSGFRQAGIIGQLIKDNKLYTIRVSCFPEDFRETHMLCLELYDSIHFSKM